MAHRRTSLGRGAVITLLLASAGLATTGAWGDDAATFDLVIKDHRFTPSELRVPAGKALVLTVRNEDASPEELESRALKVERVIAGGGSATVRVRALEKGRYPFVGEYHEDTARGVLIAE